MARLTSEQWDEVKSIYLLGAATLDELGERFGVSRAAIQKKRDKENWVQFDKGFTAKAIEDRAQLKIEVAKVAKVADGATLQVIDREIDRLSSEKALMHEDMTEIRSMMLDVMREKRDAGKLSVIECKTGMEAIAKESEVKFGKSPDTAIQINNNVGAVEDIIDQI